MRHNKTTLKTVSLFVAVSFFTQAILPSLSFAQELLLPKPDQFVNLSSVYSFPVLKGMKFDPEQPLKMEFIIDPADQKEVTQEQASQLIRYFLCGLTIPEQDIWVNLSPYEKDRITTPKLAETDLGRDLLSQDYILKQLSSSLVYPESETGKDYWQKVYREVLKVSKTTKVPVNTFNKIWISPDEAEVYEDQKQGLCLITKATLKALLEEDFLALSKNTENREQRTENRADASNPITQERNNANNLITQQINKTASEVMRNTILPQINQDVNQGENFANLRQIYHSLILAVWFKKKFKDSLYRHYINQEKIKGVDLEDKSIKEKIYNTYLEAFTKGLYNYIKTESEPVTRKKIKRQYFSGGVSVAPEALRITYDNKGLTNSPVVHLAIEALFDKAVRPVLSIEPIPSPFGDFVKDLFGVDIDSEIKDDKAWSGRRIEIANKKVTRDLKGKVKIYLRAPLWENESRRVLDNPFTYYRGLILECIFYPFWPKDISSQTWFLLCYALDNKWIVERSNIISKGGNKYSLKVSKQRSFSVSLQSGELEIKLETPTLLSLINKIAEIDDIGEQIKKLTETFFLENMGLDPDYSDEKEILEVSEVINEIKNVITDKSKRDSPLGKTLINSPGFSNLLISILFFAALNGDRIKKDVDLENANLLLPLLEGLYSEIIYYKKKLPSGIRRFGLELGCWLNNSQIAVFNKILKEAIKAKEGKEPLISEELAVECIAWFIEKNIAQIRSFQRKISEETFNWSRFIEWLNDSDSVNQKKKAQLCLEALDLMKERGSLETVLRGHLYWLIKKISEILGMEIDKGPLAKLVPSKDEQLLRELLIPFVGIQELARFNLDTEEIAQAYLELLGQFPDKEKLPPDLSFASLLDNVKRLIEKKESYSFLLKISTWYQNNSEKADEELNKLLEFAKKLSKATTVDDAKKAVSEFSPSWKTLAQVVKKRSSSAVSLDEGKHVTPSITMEEFKELLSQIAEVKKDNEVILKSEVIEEKKRELAQGVFLVNEIIKASDESEYSLENKKEIYSFRLLKNVRSLLTINELFIFLSMGQYLGFWKVFSDREPVGMDNIDFDKIKETAEISTSKLENEDICVLIKKLRSEEWDVREKAIKALVQIGQPAVGPLIEALGDENWRIQDNTIEALGRIGQPAVGPLIEALGDENWRIRENADKALQAIEKFWIQESGLVSLEKEESLHLISHLLELRIKWGGGRATNILAMLARLEDLEFVKKIVEKWLTSAESRGKRWYIKDGEDMDVEVRIIHEKVEDWDEIRRNLTEIEKKKVGLIIVIPEEDIVSIQEKANYYRFLFQHVVNFLLILTPSNKVFKELLEHSEMRRQDIKGINLKIYSASSSPATQFTSEKEKKIRDAVGKVAHFFEKLAKIRDVKIDQNGIIVMEDLSKYDNKTLSYCFDPRNAIAVTVVVCAITSVNRVESWKIEFPQGTSREKIQDVLLEKIGLSSSPLHHLSTFSNSIPGGIDLGRVDRIVGTNPSSSPFNPVIFEHLEVALKNSQGIGFKIEWMKSTTLSNLGILSTPEIQRIP